MAAVLALALAGEALLGDRAAIVGAGLPEPYQDALVLVAFGLPLLALIWLVTSWSLRPLDRASAEARRAGPQAPDLRISRAGLPAEITPLVDAVNGALDRMVRAVEAERRFTENAAHELRTPLSVLALRLQRARLAAPDWDAIDADMARMQRLVCQLLDLARKEHATPPALNVNICRVGREAAAQILPLAEQRGRALVVDLPPRLAVRGHADDLRDALRNLLENAILHGDGRIELSGRHDGGWAVLDVADEGDGVPAFLHASLFDRFAKGGSTDGSGLGLAIVQEVARLHQGGVLLLPGPGCRIRLRLPLVQEPDTWTIRRRAAIADTVAFQEGGDECDSL
jgi:two-component system sensor histidine kinase QseC